MGFIIYRTSSLLELRGGLRGYILFWLRQAYMHANVGFTNKASKRPATHQMSYGWVRTELLGALSNGVFLLALCLFIILQAIPECVDPHPPDSVSFFALRMQN